MQPTSLIQISPFPQSWKNWRVLTLNANSIAGKAAEFANLVDYTKLDVIVMTETKLGEGALLWDHGIKIVHDLIAVPTSSLISADPRTRCNHPYKFKCILCPQLHTKIIFPRTIPRGMTWTKKPPRCLPSTASSVACTSPPLPFVNMIPRFRSRSRSQQTCQLTSLKRTSSSTKPAWPACCLKTHMRVDFTNTHLVWTLFVRESPFPVLHGLDVHWCWAYHI